MSSASDVARAFGLGTPTRELTHVARGAMGVVYRLDTAEGPIAVKRLQWGASGDEKANADFQFTAADAGVPLARPLLTPSGDVVSELDDACWRAYEWVEERMSRTTKWRRSRLRCPSPEVSRDCIA
jgi:hypothetical protein